MLVPCSSSLFFCEPSLDHPRNHSSLSCLLAHGGSPTLWGFPGGSVGKESACSAGDTGSIPGSGRSPGERQGNSLQRSCLGNPMDRAACQATIRKVAKSQTRLSTHACRCLVTLFCFWWEFCVSNRTIRMPFGFLWIFLCFELQLFSGSSSAPKTTLGKVGLAPVNTLVKMCLPYLLSCCPNKAWTCLSVSVPFTLLWEVLRRSLCVLMEIGHTVWNFRSLNAPGYIVLKSVPQGALSLCLLEGRPKKLRSL